MSNESIGENLPRQSVSNYGVVDDSNWPIVQVKLIGSPASQEELNMLFQNMDALYAREEMFVVIVDLLECNYLIHPSYVYEMIRHMKKMTLYTKMYIACLCLITTSYSMTQTIQWIRTLREPSIPWHVFSTVAAAENHISEMEAKAARANSALQN